MLALSKMKSDLAFDYIAKVYLSEKKERYGGFLENALAKINPHRLEALLLSQLGAKKNSDEVKARFLINLGPVVSVKSAQLLFEPLKNPELADSASAILSKISRDKEVFAQAMKLTQSKDPNEQAFGIWAIDWYYLEDLNRLDKFKKTDTPVEVRRAVSCLYYIAHERKKIFEYANDPDDSVRRNVFYTIIPKATIRCSCFVVGTNREPARCQLAIDDQYIAFDFSNEVSIMPRQSVTHGNITSNKDAIYGIFTEVLHGELTKESLLVIPLDNYINQPNRMTEIIFKELRLSEKAPTDNKQGEIMRKLWESVPSNLLNEDY